MSPSLLRAITTPHEKQKDKPLLAGDDAGNWDHNTDQDIDSIRFRMDSPLWPITCAKNFSLETDLPGSSLNPALMENAELKTNKVIHP
jgi:hypothetical protein